MKTLKLLSVLFAIAILSSCRNDDEGNNGTTLEGDWQLRRVEGGFGGANETFEPGAITWTFDFQAQTVTVVNNQPESDYDFFESGTYPFVVNTTGEPGDCNTHLVMDNTDFGCFILSGNTLKLDQRYADGFLVTLKR